MIPIGYFSGIVPAHMHRKARRDLTSFTLRTKCPKQQELVDRHFLPGMGRLKENSSITGFVHNTRNQRVGAKV